MSEFTQGAPEVKKLGELQREKADAVRHAIELQAAAREAYCKGFYDGFKMARDLLKVAHEAQYEAARHDVDLKIEVGAEVRR
jgi:hypothetical protein